MGQIYIRGVDMPGRVRGVTVKIGDDFFILINTCLCEKVQHNAIRHEIKHIKKDHFYDCEPVVINELQAM